ncbi:MAG: hypothetical protein FWF29_08055, partial [Treponema sp.]|nr:hypothetical protein [Treponema sp.]
MPLRNPAFPRTYGSMTPLVNFNNRGFSKTSVFGKATLDLHGKTGFRTVFSKPFPKLTEFWKWLNIQKINLEFFRKLYYSYCETLV